MKSTFNPSSAAIRTLKEIIEDGKVTISMAIEGLERIEDEANGKLTYAELLASVGSLDQAKIEDQKKQEEMRKEPWEQSLQAAGVDDQAINDIKTKLEDHKGIITVGRNGKISFTDANSVAVRMAGGVDSIKPKRGEKIVPVDFSQERERRNAVAMERNLLRYPMNSSAMSLPQEKLADRLVKERKLTVSGFGMNREFTPVNPLPEQKEDWETPFSEWKLDNVPGGNAAITLSQNDNRHKIAVQRALAAGKPVPAEVLADYPDLAGKGAAPQPPEPGFTGRAANGVYFINGVAQKQQDQPTAGMPRPSAESGLGSGSMQKLTAENKPANTHSIAKLGDS